VSRSHSQGIGLRTRIGTFFEWPASCVGGLDQEGPRFLCSHKEMRTDRETPHNEPDEVLEVH